MTDGNRLKLKRILSFFVFLASLALSISWCTRFLEHKSSRVKYTDFMEADTDYDVALMGTSIMLNNILPMEMWKDYGIASYNFGSSNCTFAEDYYMLCELIKYKKPKLVVIDLLGLIEFNNIGNGKYFWTAIEAQHTQFDIFPVSRSKKEAVDDIFDVYEDRNDFLWTYITFHNRWSEIEEQDFNWRNMLNVEKGALTNTGTFGKAVFEKIPDDQTTDLAGVNYDYFIKLVNLCKREDIDVLAVYLPRPAEELNQRVANSMYDVAAKYDNLKYLNMLDLGVHDFDTDYTSDGLHPNFSGALKATDYLGQYLRDNYDLPDHSNETEWLEDEKKYKAYKKDNIVKQKELAYYLIQLYDDDFEADAYVCNGSALDDDVLMSLFDNAGIKPVKTDAEKDYDVELIIRERGCEEAFEIADFKLENAKSGDLAPRFKKIEK